MRHILLTGGNFHWQPRLKALAGDAETAVLCRRHALRWGAELQGNERVVTVPDGAPIQALWHPAVTTPLKQLLGGPIRLLFDSLFCKTGRPGGSVSWHQDYSYWTYSQPIGHATCWIALDPSDVDNGCVQYVPGSHRWGLLPRPDTLVGDAEPSLLSALTQEQRAQFNPVPAVLEAGCASFHHPLVVHGSGPNPSGRPRRGTTVHVMQHGTRAAVDEPEIDGVPAWLVGGAGPFYPPGMAEGGPRLGGRYFPLL